MSFRKRSLRKRRRGATVVEFALVVPVVFLFMFGMIELSRYVMVQQALSSAAQRGCRKAMLATTLTDESVEVAVRDYLGGALGPVADSGSVNISVSPQNLAAVTSGNDVTVRVEVGTADISWIGSDFFGGARGMVLAAQATLARE